MVGSPYTLWCSLSEYSYRGLEHGRTLLKSLRQTGLVFLRLCREAALIRHRHGNILGIENPCVVSISLSQTRVANGRRCNPDMRNQTKMLIVNPTMVSRYHHCHPIDPPKCKAHFVTLSSTTTVFTRTTTDWRHSLDVCTNYIYQHLADR